MFNTTCPVHLELPRDPVPFLSNGNINFKAHDIGWLISGIFGLIGILASFWLIDKHLTFFYAPSQQRHLVRILFMVPIYSVTSFLSYYFYNQALYFQLLRDCYEAFVISSFFHLLLSYLSSPTPTPSNPCPAPYETKEERLAALEEVFREVKVGKWMFPLGFVKGRPAGGGKGEGEAFLWWMRIGIGQYVIIRPLSTLISVISESLNMYCSTSWSPVFFHIYISATISISVSIAMYCVLQLYMPLKKELAPYRPVLKFLSVKSVVFLTFWQETSLGLLEVFGVIKSREYWSAAEIVIGLAAILSCFEMMIFGFVHIKAFTYLPYRALAPQVPTKSPVTESLRSNYPESFPPQSFKEWTQLEARHSKLSEKDKRLVPIKEEDFGRREPDGKLALRTTRRMYALGRVLDISDIFAELRHEAGYVVRNKKDDINREDDLENITGRRRENRFMNRRLIDDDEEGTSEKEVYIDEEAVKVNKWSKEGRYREHESLLEPESPRLDASTFPNIKSSKPWWQFSSKSSTPQTFEQIPRSNTHLQSHQYQTPQFVPLQRPVPSSRPHSISPRTSPLPFSRTILQHEPISSPSFDIPSYLDQLPPPHRIDSSLSPSNLPRNKKRNSNLPKSSNRISNSYMNPQDVSNNFSHEREGTGRLPVGARASIHSTARRDSREVAVGVVRAGGAREGEVIFVFEEY